MLSAGTSLATDAEGNLYFAGQYSAALDLGDGLNAIKPTPSAFVAKYGPSCEVVWIKRYDVGSQSIRFNSIAIGPSGELVAVGWLVGNGAFDGVATAGRSDNIVSSLMVTFDASDGTALEVSNPGAATEGSGLYQVAFDSEGDIVIAGWVGALATFDGEALDNSEAGVLIAKLSVGGDVRFAKVFSASEPFAQIATGDAGAIAITTMRNGSQLSYDGTAIDLPFAHRFAARLDAAGELQWTHDLDVALDPQSLPGIGMIAFDSASNIAVAHGNFLGLEPLAEEPELLSKLTPDGALLGTRVIAPPGSRPDPFAPGHFAIDALDAIVHLASVANDGETPVDAGVRAEDKTPNDVVVQKLAPDASLIWRHRFDTDVFEMPWGLALGPDGAVWVGHGEDADADPISGTLRITKLAP